jgi:2-polyprenyl-6-methoxyphenol hydroxylase-like FAD-dependent oxidoreductase
MTTKFINEPARKTKVILEADVVVVGGGPGGVASAISAARTGAKTVLVERYGHLGGMATGGLVNIIPNLADISGKQHIYGITQEILNRLDKRGGTTYPSRADWGTKDKKKVDFYHDANLGWFYLRKDTKGETRVIYTAVVDPEILKDELNTMVLESGAQLFLHSWGTQAIVENNTVKGIIFESKSGRQAILGKVIIDSTGDGDIFVSAGAEFDNELDNKRRTSWLAFNWWVTNVNLKKYDEFKTNQPEKHKELIQELAKMTGYPGFFKGTLKNMPNTVWYHCMQPQPDRTDAMDVEQLTRIDVIARKRTLLTYYFMKKYVPGFENSFIMQTAPQLGTQGGRKIIGEYTLTEKDMETDEVFEDTIAVIANNDYGEISQKHPALCIPYRCLVPKKVNGLLVACRAFSSSDAINETFNIIPHCFCYGQAAGTAAALAVKKGIEPRKVDYKALQSNLRKQGVNIPEVVAKKKTTAVKRKPKETYYQDYKGA